MSPDLLLTRGGPGAPTAAEVERLYLGASRDEPLCEGPEVAALFAGLYGALLTLAVRATGSWPPSG
jgi:hypothetical protein